LRQVRLSGSALSTSRLGFGTASLHHLTRTAARQALLGGAWDVGIRHFDTAPLYGHGIAEEELGVFLRGRRNEATLATKVGIEPSWMCARYPALVYPRMALRAVGRKLKLLPPSRHYRRHFDPKHVRSRVRKSLQLLRTDRIDILFLHEPALREIYDPDGLIHVLEDLRSAGLVRFIGLSGYAADCLPIANLYPALAGVLQLDCRTMPRPLMGAAPALAAPVSFGHFRGAANESEVRARLESAVRQNPDGCILYSTRNVARLRGIADSLAALDAA
jgi:aryl-alcohol dehydrogenase-like predicted oxidoreductase